MILSLVLITQVVIGLRQELTGLTAYIIYLFIYLFVYLHQAAIADTHTIGVGAGGTGGRFPTFRTGG